jgi:sugar/nucleoside kinase (ribokinase family)
VRTQLAVSTPAFLDLTFVGLESLPKEGEERFAGDLVRSPGGGAITAVAAARLGLRTALVAPLGGDLAGDFVRREVEAEGVATTDFRSDRMPQTVVMPVGSTRTMVTVDPGVRARAADLAALEPVAAAVSVEQVTIVPEQTRMYVTCGDDDARAYARRLPPRLRAARAFFLSETDACVLTATERPEAAAEALGEVVDTVVVVLGSDGQIIARHAGQWIDVPEFDTGPIVDPTGDRDLLCAAFVWADLQDMPIKDCVAWAQLYSRLAMTVPTATGNAVTEQRLLREGAERGLVAPSPPEAQP